ncbi:MAG: nucleotidyltransferase domain-containing protein [Lewinellaceae bacterium]|nr:nucleotidyltransferase domain-containing protein [Lewinellaceae bacterium]
METTVKEIPDQVKEAVLQIDKDAEIILFGSRARGDYGSDSDWDFLILLNDPITLEVEELIRNKIYDIELETDEVITSIIEQKSEWDKYEETLIYKNIEAQGKLVA